MIPVDYIFEFLFITSGYPWPLDTMKSPGFFKPRERHTKAQSNFFYKKFIYLFIYLIYFYNYCFWKIPHEIRCWSTSLLQHFSSLNSLSPQGSVLFTVPSSKQRLPCGAKQATYTTHSWDFRRRPPPPNTHNSITSGFVTTVGGAGPSPVGFLWRTRPGTPHGGRLTGRECWAGPGWPDEPKLHHRQM